MASKAPHAHEADVTSDLQAQAAAHDFEEELKAPRVSKEAAAEAKAGLRGTADEAAAKAQRAQRAAVDALREGGRSVEGAAGAAKERASAEGEAGSEKAAELKASAAQKADEVAASLRKEEEEGAMTATERASGRARAEAEDLSGKMQEAGGAVSDKVHDAQVSAVHAMRDVGAGIAEGLEGVADKASGVVETAKEKLGLK